MEVAGPLGTPLGLAQRKRASPRGEAGTSGFLCVSDSDRRANCQLDSQARQGCVCALEVAAQVFMIAPSYRWASHRAKQPCLALLTLSCSKAAGPFHELLLKFPVSFWLKSLLQHHSSKASILRHSAFFTVQLSHPYMTTGKTIALTRRTFVGKVTSLLLNMCVLGDVSPLGSCRYLWACSAAWTCVLLLLCYMYVSVHTSVALSLPL